MALSDRIDDFCFFDFETRALPGASLSDGNLPTAGTHRYAKHSIPIILTFAIGESPVAVRGGWNDWRHLASPDPELPHRLRAFHKRALQGRAWFVAWKTSFDRAIWNMWYPAIEPEMAIDAMCQALASNLPADLHSASTALSGPGKQTDGAKLIRLFSPAEGATPQTHPAEWERFKTYAVQDTQILRDITRATRPLSEREWSEYWASERINERGVAIDVAFCEKAALLAAASVDWSNRQLRALTGSPTLKVSTPQQIARWAYERLEDPETWSILELELPDEDEAEEDEVVATPEIGQKLQLTRAHIVRLRTALALKRARNGGLSPDEQAVDTVLELREYGGAASISKFAKMAAQADEGRLKDSYVFNGAMQTGRFSSRGVQVHNLPRDSLGELEETAIADIMDMNGPFFDRHIDRFVESYGSPGKALSRLIRPALIAQKGKVLVWADWRNIEARVNPWLSLSRSGDAKLDVFRASDRYPDQPDIYMMTAADLLGCAASDVTKAQRQSHGKVPELSLGFGGGKDALLRMAATYNVALSDEQAQEMVEQWREANPWARGFWNKLWEAIGNALDNHNVVYEAGRVSYLFKPDYLGGTLFCGLPDGRLLSYPQCRRELGEVTDKKTGEKTLKWQITYRKGHGRAALWYGKACENVVQATAGSLLRAKLMKLDDPDSSYWLPVVLHTHDDICVEVAEGDTAYADCDRLATLMRSPEDWSGGLPLAVDVSSNWFFSKAED